MTDFKRALDTLMSSVQKMVDKAIDNAAFDKTFMAIVVSKSGNAKPYTYILKVNGTEKTVTSNLDYNAGERVLVLAPRGNWSLAKILYT